MSSRFMWMIPTLVIMLPFGASGEWTDVTFDLASGFATGERTAIVGPDAAYACTRPDSGPWTVSFGLQNHFANIRGEEIRIYSANMVRFNEYNVSSGHSGRSSHLVCKFELSEPVVAADWDIGGHGKHVTPGAVFAARYSTNGADWTTAHVYAPSSPQETDPPPVRLRFAEPTRELFIGWFAEVPEGEAGWWNMGSTGMLTFYTESPPENIGSAAHPAAAATPEPEPWLQGERVVPNTFFATTTHVNNAFANTLMDDLNFRAVRIDFRYSGLHPAPDTYNFEPDMWMIVSADLGIAHGLEQLAVLTDPPGWIRDELGRYPTDEHVKTFEDFVYALASKYKGKITYWQAGNEPNLALWQERYAVFLKAFHAGVKRADPNNKVVLCGFAGEAEQHLDAVYRNGGKDYFDILAAHAYTRPAMPDEGGFVNHLRELHDVMVKHGDDKPLWITEAGWNGVEPSMLEYLRNKYPWHRNYACTEEDQARGLARMYLLAASIPWVERVYFFHLHQEAAYTAVEENVDYYMGLFTPWLDGQVRPKDAYFAMKTAIAMLNEATFRSQLKTPDRVYAMTFERGDEAFAAVWALEDGVTMRLGDASTIDEALSMVGTPVLVADNAVPVSGRPVYLMTRDLAALAAQIEAARYEGLPSFTMDLALDTEHTSAHRPAVTLTVTNTAPYPQAHPDVLLGVVPEIWRLDRALIPASQPFPAGERQTYTLSPQSDGVHSSGEVAFAIDARMIQDKALLSATGGFRYAVASPAPPLFAADGNLAEWEGLPSVSFGEEEAQRVYPDWQGADDCSLRLWWGFDAAALYLAVVVHDNAHHQAAAIPTADALWQGDSLLVAIDAGNDAQRIANVPQYDMVNDYEFGFALGSEGPFAWVFTNPGRNAGMLPLERMAIVRDEDRKETGYEFAIPWTHLGLNAPPEGRWLGINVLANDNDGAHRRGWLEWAPGIGQTKDPGKFPKVLFDAEPAAAL